MEQLHSHNTTLISRKSDPIEKSPVKTVSEPNLSWRAHRLRARTALWKRLTVVAEAVSAGTGGALVHVDFAAGAGKASATVTAEARREALRVRLLHAHAAVLARVVGLAGQVLAIGTLSKRQKIRTRTRLRGLKQK